MSPRSITIEACVTSVASAVAEADGVPVTFHRAFDEVEDPLNEVESLIGAGVKRWSHQHCRGGSRTHDSGAEQ